MIMFKSTATNLMPQIQKRTGKGIKMMSLTLTDYERNDELILDNSLTVVTMDNSKFIRKSEEVGDLFEDEVVFFNYIGGELCKVEVATSQDRFAPTRKLIQINYQNSKAQVESMLLNGIWINFRPDGCTGFILKDESSAVDVITGKEHDKSVLDSCIHYKIIGASPSSERRKIILAGDSRYDWDELINLATDGYLDINRGEKTYTEMAKESAKLFQCLPGSVSLGDCRNVAIYFGKFNEDELDGMCYGSSEGLAWHIKEAKDYDIFPRALDGLFIQGRIAQGKYGMVIVPEEMIRDKIKAVSKDTICLSWYAGTAINGFPDVFKNKVVILGDKNAPIDIFMDLNSLKSAYDYARIPEYTILRVLRENSVTNFSSTIFSKLIAKNPELAKNTVYKLYQLFMRQKIKSQFAGDGRVLDITTFDKENIFMRDVLIGAFSEYARRDKNVAYDIVKNIVEGANKSLNRLNFPVKGGNKGVIVGPENLYKIPCILKHDEIYSKTFERMFTDLGIPESEWKIFAIKYPSMDIDEYSILQCISIKEIRNRINKLKISWELKELLTREYRVYQDSIMVVPANDRFKQKHAGLDFDTDMMGCILMITDPALDKLKTENHKDIEEYGLYNDLYNMLKNSDVCVKITCG